MYVRKEVCLLKNPKILEPPQNKLQSTIYLIVSYTAPEVFAPI